MKKQSKPESEQNGKDSDICPICGGNEWILRTNEEGLNMAYECQCREKNKLKRRLNFANIPESFADMTLKTFRADVYQTVEGRQTIIMACKMIKAYLDAFETAFEKGMGLYLYSATKGSGKTRMAASIANELMHTHDKPVKFAVSTSILAEIKRTWEKESRERGYTESQLVDHLIDTPVLVIDDFGMELSSDWAKDKYCHIINERYNSRKVTIYTSNEPLRALKHDERVISRIEERTYQLHFPEESVREQLARQNGQELLQMING